MGTEPLHISDSLVAALDLMDDAEAERLIEVILAARARHPSNLVMPAA